MGRDRDALSDGECLDGLLDAIGELEKELDNLQAGPNELNVFEVLGITNTEIRHSNVIAWLMRPDGSHGLGDAVLSRLIGSE